MALDTFGNNPLFGAGLGYPERLGVLQAHNWVLYVLAQFGISGLPIIGCVLLKFWRIARLDMKVFMKLTPFIPLLIFNDRFVNMNIYPLGLYVMLMALSAASQTKFYPSFRRVSGAARKSARSSDSVALTRRLDQIE